MRIIRPGLPVIDIKSQTSAQGESLIWPVPAAIADGKPLTRYRPGEIENRVRITSRHHDELSGVITPLQFRIHQRRFLRQTQGRCRMTADRQAIRYQRQHKFPRQANGRLVGQRGDLQLAHRQCLTA
ncbi:Uncharacterised protein [Salmonella enterica subsp. enterica serovar Bovismorbificans]|uniref:Uncharacterized protein n=1 Tax=Salmonella enterica subsp. enterica serovar Bovismorbificans TaxID=58097 RepID=A0A655BTB1_SALET|nr:Uncharacterised protein [Salmonella enterica subsp. enterica serovar Bovismorbificans]